MRYVAQILAVGLPSLERYILLVLKLVGIICKCFQGRTVHWIFMLIPCWWLSAKVAEGRANKSATGKKKEAAKAPGKAAPP